MLTVKRTAPAPEGGIGTEVIGVPVGADIEMDLRLESVVEGILVSGDVLATAVGECVRCLEEVELPLDVTLQELFVYPDRAQEVDEEEDVREIEDELIDLDPAVRDAVVPVLPFTPLCRDDCPGLCSACGARLADEPEHRHDVADPRWAALQGLAIDGGADDEKEN